MKKRTSLVIMALFVITALITGCADNQKLENIEVILKEMNATLKNIETKLDKLPKTAAAPGRPAVDYNKVHNFSLKNSAIKGNVNAPVTVVEFSDFQCPYCAKFVPTIDQVLKVYPNDVRFVYKDFPLSFHKQAKNAAKAARAAGEQGKFWEMHDLIFTKYNTLTVEMFKEFATKLDLDMAMFEADFNSNKYDKFIQQDIAMGIKAGVAGTPTLYVNGKRMQRRSFNDFKATIDAILQKKKKG